LAEQTQEALARLTRRNLRPHCFAQAQVGANQHAGEQHKDEDAKLHLAFAESKKKLYFSTIRSDLTGVKLN